MSTNYFGQIAKLKEFTMRSVKFGCTSSKDKGKGIRLQQRMSDQAPPWDDYALFLD